MAERLDILNAIINSTKQQYKTQNKKDITNADDLVTYARTLFGDNFNVWDEVYDDDQITGNKISKNRYFANDQDLLFQTSTDSTNLTNTVELYDLSTESMKTISNKSDVWDLLYDMSDGKDDILTDSKSQKVSKNDFVNNSKLAIRLVKDGFEIIGLPAATSTTTTSTTTSTSTSAGTSTSTSTSTKTSTTTTTSTLTNLSTQTAGDPHYYVNNQHVFDHQGIIGSEYLELDNDSMRMISKRGKSGNGIVITDESIELKGSNITVVGHINGKYDVHQTDANGKDIIIANQDGPLTANAAKILADAGIQINFKPSSRLSNLTVTYQGRTASLDLDKSCINDKTATNYGDTGLRSQAAAVYDKMNERNADGTITIDGKKYYYDPTQQDMVAESGHTSFNLDRKISGKNITARDAIMADLAKVDKDGKVDGWVINSDGTKVRLSLADAYRSTSGYTAAEFDELVAQLMYTADSKYF